MLFFTYRQPRCSINISEWLLAVEEAKLKHEKLTWKVPLKLERPPPFLCTRFFHYTRITGCTRHMASESEGHRLLSVQYFIPRPGKPHADCPGSDPNSQEDALHATSYLAHAILSTGFYFRLSPLPL